jgi:hypothetical protein
MAVGWFPDFLYFPYVLSSLGSFVVGVSGSLVVAFGGTQRSTQENRDVMLQIYERLGGCDASGVGGLKKLTW